MSKKKRRCWTGASDEEIAAEDPELAREIQKRREKLIKEFESKREREEPGN